MGAFAAIVRNTFTETLRQPVYGLILAFSCVLIAIIPATANHIYVFTEGTGLEQVPQRLIADLGLATVQVAGLILAVFVTASVISDEVEHRTAATVLTKPIGRGTFILGKYCGLAAAVSLMTAAGAMITLLTIRVGSDIGHGETIDWGVAFGMVGAAVIALATATFRNYFAGKSWVGAFNLSFIAALAAVFAIFAVIDADYHVIFEAHEAHDSIENEQFIAYDGEVALGALLTMESVLIIVGIALAASTRLGPIGNAAVSGTWFVLGLLHRGLSEAPDSASLFSKGLSWAMVAVPRLELFWMSDALVRGQPIPASYLASASAYAACAIAAALFTACLLFERRDVG